MIFLQIIHHTFHCWGIQYPQSYQKLRNWGQVDEASSRFSKKGPGGWEPTHRRARQEQRVHYWWLTITKTSCRQKNVSQCCPGRHIPRTRASTGQEGASEVSSGPWAPTPTTRRHSRFLRETRDLQTWLHPRPICLIGRTLTRITTASAGLIDGEP